MVRTHSTHLTLFGLLGLVVRWSRNAALLIGPSLIAADAVAQSSTCPDSINVRGQQISVAEPIQARGSASSALQAARGQLQFITNQGSCGNMANREECEINLEAWTKMVKALECHAGAAGRTSAGTANSKTSNHSNLGTPSDPGPSQSVAQASTERLLGMLDPPAVPAAPKSKSDDGSNGAFPTPYCRFMSDPKIRHKPRQYVCYQSAVYECRDQSSARPKDAWFKVGTGGCGSVRSVQAIEDELHKTKKKYLKPLEQY